MTEERKYVIGVLISVICIILFGILLICCIRGCIHAVLNENRQELLDAKFRTKQKGEIKFRDVYYGENYNTFHIMDVPIEGKRHEYLIYRKYSDMCMTHYPNCKYCTRKE